MNKIETFSLAKHSRFFAVPAGSNDYLFVRADNHPYQEEPYRAESYALAFLREGSIDLQAGLVKHSVKAPAVITLGPSVIRSFTKSSELIRMDVLFFKDTFLLEGQADIFLLTKYDFLDTSDLHVLALSGISFQKINGIFDLVALSMGSDNAYQANIIRSYILVLIYEIDAAYRAQSLESKVENNLNPLVASFRKSLTQNYLCERSLGFYAQQLSVTPKYLSAVIKKQTGRTAAEWIDEAVILESKVLLQKKSLTISQISNCLNFSDQSVFGKFFKAQTGISPLEYRKEF